MASIKVIIRTLMVVVIALFCGLTFNYYIKDGIARAHPLKTLGEGKDSASHAKFLILEESSWVTGQIIAVDGGRSKLS